MAYTKEAVVETAAQSPMAAVVNKEERTIEPYAKNDRIAKATAAVNGQINNDGSTNGQEAPKATEETVTLSPQVAALARKEQRFRQQQQQLKDREAALEKDKAEVADLRALKAKLEAKDYSAIEGQVNYDDYTNYLINKNSTMTPEQQALKKLESKMEKVEKDNEDNISKQFEAAVNFRRKAVVDLVETNTEFKRIKGLKAQEAVVQHILNTWEQDEVDLSPEQAAKEVEEVLKEREAVWLALGKEEVQEQIVDEKKPLPPLKQGVKTLTNNMTTAGDNKRPLKSLSQMSEGERYAEARRRAEEKLKLKGRI